MIIRNDDASWYHTLDDFKRFCEICDKHKVKIIQAISPLGQLRGYDRIRAFDSSFDNEKINSYCGDDLPEEDFVEYLKSRNDFIGIHGLHHNHRNTKEELIDARRILTSLGLKPTYLVTPFNELSGDEEIGLIISAKCQRLEEFLDSGTPTDEIVYLHAWRFTSGNDFGYSYDKLDQCLSRLTS